MVDNIKYKDIDPKQTVWKHANNIAHGSNSSFSGKKSLNLSMNVGNQDNEVLELSSSNKTIPKPLKDNKSIQVSFKGLGFLQSILKDLEPVERQNAIKLYNYIRPFLKDTTQLAYEKAIELGSKKGNRDALEIIIRKPFHYRLYDAITGPFNTIADLIKIGMADAKTAEKIEAEKEFRKTLNNIGGYYRNINNILKIDVLKPEEIKKLGQFGSIQEVYKLADETLENLYKSGKFKIGNLDELLNIKIPQKNPATGKMEEVTVGNLKLSEFSKIKGTGDFKSILGELKKKKNNTVLGQVENLETLSNLSKLKDTIVSGRNKKRNSVLANYSTTIMSPIVRIVSGLLAGLFVATDFANLRRLIDDDAKAATKEWVSKFKQHTANIGLSAYMMYFVNTTFKQAVNSSMQFAVGMNFVNILIAEVVSRKLTGRPILFEKAEKKYNSAVTSLNKYMESISQSGAQTPFAAFVKSPKSQKSTTFTGSNNDSTKDDKKPTKVSFAGGLQQGLFKTVATIGRNEFVERMQYLKLIDRKDYDTVLGIMEKILQKASGLNKANIREIVEAGVVEKGKGPFPDVTELPLGKNSLYNITTRTWDALFMPARLFTKIGLFLVYKPIAKFAPKTYERIYELSPSKILKALKNFASPPKSSELSSNFVKNTIKFVNEAKSQTAPKAKLEEVSKDSKLVRKLKENYGKIDDNHTNDSDKASYDSSIASIFFKLTGMASIPFLFREAAIVAKRESGDPELAAQKSRERAAQDLTRQAISLWVVAAFNTIFKEFYNASLIGASIVTTLSVASNESLTRMSVGVPILPKAKAKLEELDRKNFNRTGLSAAYFRVMSGLTGKKPLSERLKNKNNANKPQVKLPNELLSGDSSNALAQKGVQLQHGQAPEPAKLAFNPDNSLIPSRFKAKSGS